MVKIKVIGKQFDVSAKMVKSGVPFPNDEPSSWTRHNKFNVKVCSEIKLCRSFNFYDSHANMEKGKTELGSEDLKDAFQSFLSDATYGTMSFQEFCSETGYSEDSRRAHDIYTKGIKKSYKQAQELGFSDDELYEAVNEMSRWD